MVVYRLESNKELDIVNNSWLYDVDLDCITKKEYIAKAKKLTDKANQEFGTNYTYEELFGKPVDSGWRYCKKCGMHYWLDDGCECD